MTRLPHRLHLLLLLPWLLAPRAQADPARAMERAARLLRTERTPSSDFRAAEALLSVGQLSSAMERYLSALVSGLDKLGARAGQRLTQRLAFPLSEEGMRRLAELELDTLPADTRQALWHRLGLFFLRRGELERADAFLRRASSRPGARYLSGAIALKKGRASRARAVFLSTHRLAERMGRSDLSDLASLALARLALDRADLPRAAALYGRIRYGSPLYARARQEMAWVHLARLDPARVLGESVGLNAPLLRLHYRPDREVVEAAALLALCRTSEARRRLRSGIERLERDLNKLTRFLRPRPDERLYYVEAMAAAARGGREFSRELVSILLADASFRQVFAVVRQLQLERRLLLKPEAEALRRELSGELDRRLVSAQQRAGATVKGILSGQVVELKELQLRSQELRFDTHGQAARQALHRRSDEGGADGKRAIAPGRQQTWRFTGEFWSDEIAHYIVRIKSRCTSRSRRSP